MIKWILISLLVFCLGCSTAQREFGADALLRKYETFKNMSAALDAKLASIKVQERKIKNLEDQYKGIHRKDWNRTDAEQHSIWSSELGGMKDSYNRLASDYNANMAKNNWAFTNAGDLPRGASHPLPREYKPYIEE